MSLIAQDEEATGARTDRVEAWLTVPVLVAALVSVPAVFLAAWGEGVWAKVGLITDWAAAGVLWIEWLTLMLLAQNPLGWLRRHKWTVTVALLSIPAVMFTLGPAQLLRLAYVVSTLRIMRVRRIINAARAVNRRLSGKGHKRLLLAATCLVSGAFAGVLLLDPAGETWLAVDLAIHHVGLVSAVVLVTFGIAALAVYWWSSRRPE